MSVTFKIRRDTAANWTSANSVLALGEPAYETTSSKTKYGDGVTAWNSLPYSVGSVSWGAITGTLTSQTDLNTALNAKLVKTSNLSDLASAATARTNLGLGTLATQSGIFSGTSSGTNTGDQSRSSLRSSCKVTLSASLATNDFNAGYVVPWNTETWDDANWHDNTTNPERMTVPAGVDRAEFMVGLRLTGLTASVTVLVQVLYNGATVVASNNGFNNGTTMFIPIFSSYPCVAGDYFTVKVNQAGGTTSGTVAAAASTTFVIKAV